MPRYPVSEVKITVVLAVEAARSLLLLMHQQERLVAGRARLVEDQDRQEMATAVRLAACTTIDAATARAVLVAAGWNFDRARRAVLLGMERCGDPIVIAAQRAMLPEVD